MREPYSLEAEHGVLGAILIRPELADILTRDLVKTDFFFSDNREVYQAIVSLLAASKPIDVITVAERIGTLVDDDGLACSPLPYLDRLFKNTPSAANAKAYAQIVKERATDRALQLVATQIHDIAHSDEQTEAKIAQVQGLAMGIDAKAATQETITAREVMQAHIDEIDRRFTKGTELDGLSTGIDSLDAKFCGLKGGQLIVIAGRPKMGKTTLAMNFATYNALHAKKSVLVVSLEMNNTQLMDRIIASEASIPLGVLKSGKLEDDHWPRLTALTNKIADCGLSLSTRRGISISGVRSMARRHKLEHGLDLLLIDHIGLLDGEDRRQGTVERISEITRQSKLLAMELNVPVIILSQLNRALEQRPDKRPIPSDLRDSGSIEQDADMILFVYRDEVYNPQTEYRGVAEIIIGAARDIEAGTVRTRYQGNYSKFSDLSADFEADEPPPPHKPYAPKRGMDLG